MQIELKKIASVFNGKTPSKDEQRESGFPVLKIKDIDDRGFFRDNFDSFIDYQLAEKLRGKYTKIGDTLILNAAHNADYVGTKKCFVSEEFSDVLATGEWSIIRPNLEKVIPKYLFFILNSPGFQFTLQNVVKGIHLYPKDLERILVFCPSLEYQKRIIKKLDEADALRQKRKQSIGLLDDYLRSMFLKMFGDPVKNPMGWKTLKLGKLCTIRRGASPRPIKDFIGNDVAWVKIGDATNGDDVYITDTKVKIKKEGEVKSVVVNEGDLVFANCGVSLGFARIMKIKGCIHDGWLIFQDIDPKINKIFLLKLLNHVTKYFREIAPDGTQPNLNTGIMKNFSVILPGIEKQNRFSELVNLHQSLKQKMLVQSEELENQFQALMQKAFKGGL